MSHHIRNGLLAAAALSSLALPCAATGQTRDPAARESSSKYLTYYLPKAQIAAAVSQRLVRCERKKGVGGTEDEIEVETTWTLKARAMPDYGRPIAVDVSSGFLASRTVGMKFNPDGTLVSINAKSTGQGGAVLASVIKLAGTIAPIAVGVPPMAINGAAVAEVQPPCHKNINTLLERHAELAGRIDMIEAAIAEGNVSTTQKDLLAVYRLRLLAIEKELTITRTAEGLNAQVACLKAYEKDPDCKPQGEVLIAAFGYENWFPNQAVSAKDIPGSKYGFVVRWAGSAEAAKSFDSDKGSRQRVDDFKQLVYLRPVPAILIGTPCADLPKDNNCTPDENSPHVSASLEFALPQLSPPFALPVGSAGIFGSREVAASFDSWGRPTELTYGSDPGGAAFAGAIDAIGATATSIHNAELNAIKHEVELEEAKEKLEAFQQQTLKEE